ncbi:hypothetical protein BRC2024_KCUCJSVR_CDS_0053 [Acinetobacter phage vB_AbaM_KissB]
MTQKGFFRTDWTDVKPFYEALLSEGQISQEVFDKVYRAVWDIDDGTSYTSHPNPWDEAENFDYETEQKVRWMLSATGDWLTNTYPEREEEIETRYTSTSRERGVCGCPNLKVLSTWIDEGIIDSFKIAGYQLFELELKPDAIYVPMKYQVVYFKSDVVKQTELSFDLLKGEANV